MFKMLHDAVWVFDVEWVPDPVVGRRIHKLPPETPDAEVIAEMWKAGGATKEDPMPYLKTLLCRVVSIAAVTRRRMSDGTVQLHLTSLPHDVEDPEQTDEAAMLTRFLGALGEHRPQLVGFNSQRADLKILTQRAVACGIQASGFAQRPNKPWEGVDYWARESDFNVDLMSILGSYGKSTPSLHEMALACKVPGKLSSSGEEVAPMWLEGLWSEIVAYNETDALTTYLIWLRLAHFGGFLSSEAYKQEQEQLKALLRQEGESGKLHLLEYLEDWEQLQSRE
ncbi:MAG: hypothetical protein ACO4AU_05310 [bacterium]